MTDKPEPLDLEALREKADATTLGWWRVHYSPKSSLDPHGTAVVYIGDVSISDGRHHICELSMFGQRAGHHPDAAFIAAANPQTVLALITEVERLRSNQSHLEEIASDSRDRSARLKAALEPFKRIYQTFEQNPPLQALHTLTVQLFVSDLRNAAKAAEGE